MFEFELKRETILNALAIIAAHDHEIMRKQGPTAGPHAAATAVSLHVGRMAVHESGGTLTPAMVTATVIRVMSEKSGLTLEASETFVRAVLRALSNDVRRERGQPERPVTDSLYDMQPQGNA